MELVSLKELCKEVGVSRRTIQGYEDARLIKASCKNKYGYLQYSFAMVERAKLVKFYRDIGLSNREIVRIIDAPGSVLVEVLNERVRILEDEIQRKEALIEKVQMMIKEITKGERI